VLNVLQRKESFVAATDQAPLRRDDKPNVTHEKCRDPFAGAPRLPFVTPAAVARAIQRDGAAVGLPLDDAVTAEVADAMLEALRDDEEAALDLASFVFDADVRRALAS
jgi:hypothetical protein